MPTAAEQKNYKVISGAVSFTVHIMIFLLFFFTKMISDTPVPPIENGGVLVALGQPDQGMNDEPTPGPPSADSGNPTSSEEAEEEPQPVEREPVREEPRKTEPVREKEPEKVTTEDPNAIAIKQRQAKEKADAQAKKDADAKAKRDADAQAKREADAQAKRDADAKALKDKLAGGFGGGGNNGSGKGSGSGGKTGNQGQPDGDPDGKALEGVSTGTGTIGGGLGSRGYAKKGPGISDNSSATGSAVIEICVDADGNVVGEPKFKQLGSSISDNGLIRKAISDAKQWRFNKGDVDKQCGTITYRFRVQ